MSEKPLHVRVAEALGVVICDQWTVLDFDPWNGSTFRANCDHKGCVPTQRPPRYDTDWSATGPLIERFKVDVWYRPGGVFGDAEWGAVSDHEADTGAMAGGTPLIAVCNLILALHAAGKLPVAA